MVTFCSELCGLQETNNVKIKERLASKQMFFTLLEFRTVRNNYNLQEYV